jgi:hypothetical protein
LKTLKQQRKHSMHRHRYNIQPSIYATS